MLGNLYDFDPATDSVPGGELREIDQWILLRGGGSGGEVPRLVRRTSSFTRCITTSTRSPTVDLSSIYFDVLKDRLYTSAAKSKARRSAQTALYRLLDALVRLLAPIMSFTTEEVWGAAWSARAACIRRCFRRRGN